MLSFFPRDVLDEILNLIESVSEGFPSYSYTTIGGLVVLRFTALSESISVYTGPHPRDREREERNDR